MSAPIKWRYEVSDVDDDLDAVRELMKNWAEAGWELVSADTTSWVSKGYEDTMRTWHTRYTLFWRKPAE